MSQRRIKFIQISDVMYLVADADTLEHLMSITRFTETEDGHWKIAVVDGEPLMHAPLPDCVQLAVDFYEAEMVVG